MYRNNATSQHGARQFIRFTRYALPDPLASYEDLMRFTNADVGGLTPPERWAEAAAARDALAAAIRSGAHLCIVSPDLEHVPAERWLAERVHALRDGAR